MRRETSREATLPATLDRAFSRTGWGSRTRAREWIEAGRVRVNGETVRNPDHWVDLARDRIALDGKPPRFAARHYIQSDKPGGFLTTRYDPGGRPTVYNPIKDVNEWLSPVGRLDPDSSVMPILNGDTAFADLVTSPRHELPKPCRVKTAKTLCEGSGCLEGKQILAQDTETKQLVLHSGVPGSVHMSLGWKAHCEALEELGLAWAGNGQARYGVIAIGVGLAQEQPAKRCEGVGERHRVGVRAGGAEGGFQSGAPSRE